MAGHLWEVSFLGSELPGECRFGSRRISSSRLSATFNLTLSEHSHGCWWKESKGLRLVGRQLAFRGTHLGAEDW